MRFPAILRIIRVNCWGDRREFLGVFQGICATSATNVKFRISHRARAAEFKPALSGIE